jgi:hypothetical protein
MMCPGVVDEIGTCIQGVRSLTIGFIVSSSPGSCLLSYYRAPIHFVTRHSVPRSFKIGSGNALRSIRNLVSRQQIYGSINTLSV